jgi:hypothetical protein
MSKTRYSLVVLAALLILGAMPALAQQKPAPGGQQEADVASGELQKVDTTARTIAIRTAAGSQMQFSYTDETRVAGADKGVAGLATMSGTPVTIRFTKKDQVNVAISIEVQKKR